MKQEKMLFKTSSNNPLVGYLYLEKHPRTLVSGAVKKSISLKDLIEGYKGIPVYLDFDENDELIGIEIVG